jgi:hypothetical protein
MLRSILSASCVGFFLLGSLMTVRVASANPAPPCPKGYYRVGGVCVPEDSRFDVPDGLTRKSGAEPKQAKPKHRGTGRLRTTKPKYNDGLPLRLMN